MTTKNGNNKKQILIRLSDDVNQKLTERADQLGMSKTGYITHLILMDCQQSKQDEK